VKWCELDTIFDSLQDLIVNQSRFLKQFSTMDNAMAYRVNVSFASNPELSDLLSEIFWTRYSEGILNALQRCRECPCGSAAMLNLDVASPESFDFSAAQAIILTLLICSISVAMT